MAAWRWLSAVLVLTSCYASHQQASFAVPDGGDGSAPLPLVVPHRCLSPSSASWTVGGQAHCERRTIALNAPTYVCREPNFTSDFPLELRAVQATELRVLRTDLGSVVLHVEPGHCSFTLRSASELDCGRCSEASRPENQLGPFPDDGLMELLLVTDPALGPPCPSIDLEICFDPNYSRRRP